MKEELSKPLDPKYISTREAYRGGPVLSYIEGHHAIREANRIFGFDGWSKYVHSLDQVQCEQVESNGKKLWYVGYTCTGRVTVGHKESLDVGFGQGIDKDLGRAHESAVKEAVTDMMKRCLKDFGDPFGLALYDKAKAHVGDPRDEPKDEFKPGPYLKSIGIDGVKHPIFVKLKKAHKDWQQVVKDYHDTMQEFDGEPTPEHFESYIGTWKK